MATETINPRKATGALHQLFISWAKFYEQPPEGVEPDIESARGVLEKAVTVPFKRVDDLAEVWIAWSEMEVRLDNFDEARQVMARASSVPRKTNISFHDEVRTSEHTCPRSNPALTTILLADTHQPSSLVQELEAVELQS